VFDDSYVMPLLVEVRSMIALSASVPDIFRFKRAASGGTLRAVRYYRATDRDR
jgi:hypothetical protein